jgi:hypothetical protein
MRRMLSRAGRDDDTTMPAPVVVLGSGQRCGSTLVQRLLTSHPRVLVWGEQGGHLDELLAHADVLRAWDANVAAHGRASYAEHKHHGWLANMLPGPEAIDDAVRAYVEALFARPAQQLGKPCWGFKEVHLARDHMLSLQRLFPALRVVHITRDPRDVLRSLDAWERADEFWRRDFTERAMSSWRRVNASFLDTTDPWVVSVRYESVIADPDAFIARLADLMGAASDEFDRGVFDRNVRDYGGPALAPQLWSELPADLRSLLDDGGFRALAASYSYDL